MAALPCLCIPHSRVCCQCEMFYCGAATAQLLFVRSPLIAQGRLVTAIYIAGCEINALPCQLIAQIAGDKLTDCSSSECWWLSARWEGVVAGVGCGSAGPISVTQLCKVVGAFWKTTTSLSNTS